MSPRFSGRQYPGAMKDHRARKRDEAAARQQQRNDTAVVVDTAGGASTNPFTLLARAFESFVEEMAKIFTPTPTQADYALVPGEIKGGYTGAPRYDFAGALPTGVTLLRNETGQPIFFSAREERDDVGRLARDELHRRARGEQ